MIDPRDLQKYNNMTPTLPDLYFNNYSDAIGSKADPTGDYKTAGEIIKQTKIDPDTFPGLEKRRGRESNMFLSYLSQNNKINA